MATKDIAVDTLHKEIFVVADSANQVDIYSLDKDTSSAATKLRQITATALNGPSGIVYDEIRDQILVSNGSDAKILVFDRESNGSTTPLRIINL